MYSLVLSVSDVNAAMTKSLPPYLMLNVSGSVPTTGWTKPELSPSVYFVEPKDGIWDFHFIAELPDGIVSQVVTPISASLTVLLPHWCRGVRIIASTNKVQKSLYSRESEVEENATDIESFAVGNIMGNTDLVRDPGDAWPWVVGSEAIQSAEARIKSLLNHPKIGNRSDLKVDSLIGRKIRVVQKGGVITDDFDPDRVTFLLNEQGRIEDWLPF